MSFICGSFSIEHLQNHSQYSNKFDKESKNYIVEPYTEASLGAALFGCGIQRFSLNSDDEVLPIKDEEKGILFVADCIIDNKNELAEELGEAITAPDARLLFEAYTKWGTSFGVHVCGSFSFVAYHRKENILVLCSDHMNTRSLYYCTDRDSVLFCNSIASLARVIGMGLSEKWCSACLYTEYADLTIYDTLTPFEGIYQLKPASIVTIKDNKIDELVYWSPLKLKFDRPEKTEEEYKVLFVNTFKKCVHEMLKVKGRKGCTLSGGLDSTSVAALAASELEGESLFSFTSIPEKEYDAIKNKKEDDGHSVVNESDNVNILRAEYENIISEFVDCKGTDAFSELSRLIPVIGYPMKSGQNLTWLDGIYKSAESKGVKLILKGQFGNSTISHGEVLSAFYQDLARLKPRKAIETARRFCRVYHVPKKAFGKIFLEEYMLRFFKRKIENDIILTNANLATRCNTKAEVKASLKGDTDSRIESHRQRLECLHDPVALNQLGMFDTIMGLKYGILIRDPSKDRRMVELCAKLPPSCMVAGGYERGQVRSFMEGYVPEPILKDIYRRGLQSADYFFRVRKNWEIRKKDIIEKLENPRLVDFANPEIVTRIRNLVVGTDVSCIEDDDIRKMNVLYSFSVFLYNYDSISDTKEG